MILLSSKTLDAFQFEAVIPIRHRQHNGFVQMGEMKFKQTWVPDADTSDLWETGGKEASGAFEYYYSTMNITFTTSKQPLIQMIAWR